MSYVFISYRREDSAKSASQIYEHLVQRLGQKSIFKSVDTIELDVDLRHCPSISVVGQCDVLLVLIGRKWLQIEDANGQRWLDVPTNCVRLELETALNRSNVRVIPVLLENAEMPTKQDLPASLQSLVDCQCIHVPDAQDLQKDMECIFAAIQPSFEPADASDKTQAAQTWFKRAVAAQNNGELKAAIISYDKAIQLNPNYAPAYSNRGVAKSCLGDKPGMLADYDKAIQLNPNYAGAYSNRGLAKANLGDLKGAIADYTQAIRLKPDAVAYSNRGLAKASLGDKQGAIADYTQAIQLKPNYAAAYNNCGLVKSGAGEKQQAIVDYDQAIRLNPNYAIAYNNRGAAKAGLGDKQGAIADYTQAIQLNPNCADAYIGRAFSRYALGDKKNAMLDRQKAMELFKQQGNIERYNLVASNLKGIGKVNNNSSMRRR
ncbi:MAG: tetratricopeptide repeat protein [Cyanobacteria bacterium P01_D01_bin.105]